MSKSESLSTALATPNAAPVSPERWYVRHMLDGLSADIVHSPNPEWKPGDPPIALTPDDGILPRCARPGDIIDRRHLDGIDIDRLVAVGAIQPLPPGSTQAPQILLPGRPLPPLPSRLGTVGITSGR